MTNLYAHQPSLDDTSLKPLATEEGKVSLIGMSREQIMSFLSGLGVADKHLRMRTQQLWNWIYVRGIDDFDIMLNIARDLRDKLQEKASLDAPDVVSEQISMDGTRKWLLRFPPNAPGELPADIEMVYIPEEDRGTLCVSSQVGCTLNCTFCHTGSQKLVRNLTAEEIVAQIRFARQKLGDFPEIPRPTDGLIPNAERAITNIVMMGMGEPLYNFENVRDALLIASDNEGMNYSRRRITLSTSGIVPEIERCGAEIGVMLAISLHAVRDDLRNELVPINKKYPIHELLEACKNYPGLANAKRITFEYVMLKDVNDSLADAKELVRLLKGIPAKINLIPFNPWPGSPYECSEWEQIEKFADVVNRAGYASPIRTPRGRDIFAACGQLKSESKRLSFKERQALMEKQALIVEDQ